jgi:hypothetical protein
MRFTFSDGSNVSAWKNKDGYLTFKINGKNTSIHRHQYFLNYGPITDGMTINHKDGNKLNNSPENLEEMTFSENAKHSWVNNLAKPCKGSSHGRSVLDEIKVLTILTMPKNSKNGVGNGWTNKSISDCFGVSTTRINAIRNGREWKHVHDALRN